MKGDLEINAYLCLIAKKQQMQTFHGYNNVLSWNFMAPLILCGLRWCVEVRWGWDVWTYFVWRANEPFFYLPLRTVDILCVFRIIRLH